MIVYEAYLGDSRTSDSIRNLLASGDLVPIDSWSETNLTYEKYETESIMRVWDKIVKAPDGLQSFDKVPMDGWWGILYEK